METRESGAPQSYFQQVLKVMWQKEVQKWEGLSVCGRRACVCGFRMEYTFLSEELGKHGSVSGLHSPQRESKERCGRCINARVKEGVGRPWHSLAV